jgi:type I restriction enzyme R subunit
MGVAIRLPFRKEGEPGRLRQAAENDGPEEQIARIIRAHDLNQLFVAFSATPAPATVTMFGKPFDTYSEAEAIAEGYIVDVAASIISYKTLYNLHCASCPKAEENEGEKLYPAKVSCRGRCRTWRFQDDGLIQYKAEVMLRIFEKDVQPLIGGSRQGDDRHLVARRRPALFQNHPGEAQGARRRLQGALRLLGFRPSAEQRSDQRARREPVETTAS